MRNELLVQYGALRETIKTNVNTIGNLFKQAESLKKIVETVSDTKIKQSLTEEVARIDVIIGDLIVQTNNLFDKYDEFVKTVFSAR